MKSRLQFITCNERDDGLFGARCLDELSSLLLCCASYLSYHNDALSLYTPRLRLQQHMLGLQNVALLLLALHVKHL